MSAARPLLNCTNCAAEYDQDYIERCECDICFQPPLCPTCWSCLCESGIGGGPQYHFAAA
jgi:hypothetical protein